MGYSKALVEVEVHDVETHVPWPGHAQDGVQVGAVVVEQAPRLMDHGCQFGDVLFEEAEGVRVGEHDARDVGVQVGAQVGRFHQAPFVRRHAHGAVTSQVHRGGVGAVGGVGDEDLARRTPVVRVPGTH